MKNKNHKTKIIFTLTLGLILTANLIVDNKPWAQQKKQGIFIAVAYQSKTAVYSTDGIKWVKTTLPDAGWAGWDSICYGNGKFVAIPAENDKVAYSTDGTNWKETTLPYKLYREALYYKNGIFLIPLSYKKRILYSTDGINWKLTKLPYRMYGGIIYGNNKFLTMVGDNKIAYSANAIKWQITTLPVRIGCPVNICYGNGIFLTGTDGHCDEESTAIYSADGINWMAIQGKTLSALSYRNGKFIDVDFDYGGASYSTDGKKWVEITFPDEAKWNTVFYGNEKFIALAEGDKGKFKAAYSTDAVNWKTTKLPIDIDNGLLCSGNGMFVGIPRRGDEAIYSYDGIKWEKTTIPINAEWTAICYGGD